MKKGITLRDRVVKHFFNISGDFDEYKRQEVNRIGTNALLMCIPALLLPPLIAIFWATTSPEYALLGIILFNSIFFGVVVCPYLAIACHRAHLTDNEVDANDMPMAWGHVLKSALGQAIYFAVFTYLLKALLNWFFDGDNFVQQLVSLGNIKGSVLGGIFFGVIMGITNWGRLKKQL
ncbi:DUF3278 domain-containing protein [Levilactobacillus parabrevis]|uniref:DUF3278 domain-containing protein n=1 Tax=Levilactobacillus parabrevis TaxID=357278 RepID=UPI0021A860AC|nr:DUF3278 domain-containing protein [Levilactobacillus parabrevis]MCT4486898.1 DUF3278 domain-containing protein [Levilactobacillus parabrevis]MCT4489473.1 DUF3278 domain-containing protein [Levilactobacillus parabrevis]